MKFALDTSKMSVEEKAVAEQFAGVFSKLDEAIDAKTQEALTKWNADATVLGERMTALAKENGELKTQNGDLVKRFTGVDAELLKLKGLGGMRVAGGDFNPESLKSFAERLLSLKEWKDNPWSGRIKQQFSLQGRLRTKANTITEGGTTPSGLVMVPQRVGIFTEAAIQPRLQMRDMMTVVPLTGTNAVEYQIETWNYAADYQILEGDKKAQGDVTYTEHTATAKTIAWFVKVSRQMLSDAPFMQSNIQDNLVYGVLKKEDKEILYGNNAAGHLWGIMPQATALPADYLPDMSNNADQIMAAIAYLADKGYMVSGIVLNPLDWAALSIAKTPQGLYLLGGPPQSTAPTSLWGLQLTITMAMAKGDFLVGAFPGNQALFDKETVTVDVAFENEDDFVRNLVTMRAEERIAMAIFRPQAFVKGPFADLTLP